MCPAVGAIRPSNMRMVVVLPAPFGPRKPYTWPAATSRSSSLTAIVSPKRLVRLVQLMTFMP